MFGWILGGLMAVLGLYLLGDTLWRAARCTDRVEATVVFAPAQERQLGRRQGKFPRYRFTQNGEEYFVTDYNAPRRGTALGDRLILCCTPRGGNRCWYVAGRLWPDAVYGALALTGAAGIGVLYLL